MSPQSPKLPVPLCVRAATGMARPPLRVEDLNALPADVEGAATRSADQKVLRVAWTVRDPMDLTRAGWGIVFATNVDPAIRAALEPLLQLRQRQVQDPKLFQVFEGPARGVSPGMGASSWAFSRGVSLTAPVDPRKGVPYYMLLVGPPQSISFAFEAMLKMQWAVGRLCLDHPDDYRRYAEAVVAYEDPTATPTQARRVAAWMTANPDDDATLLLSSAMAEDFDAPDARLGEENSFALSLSTGEDATKERLTALVHGTDEDGAPAVVFTGSHGLEYPPDDAEAQRRFQGALLTQEWAEGATVSAAVRFAAEDVQPEADLRGRVFFLFACFSGGCPRSDSYRLLPDGTRPVVAAEDRVAALPQALLARGALAVFAHLDVAFAYAFSTDEGTPQPQVLRTPLELLMQGRRAGLAADALTSLWSALAAQVGAAEPLAGTATRAEKAALANLHVARDDARNFLLLGDPAVRLRVEDLRA